MSLNSFLHGPLQARLHSALRSEIERSISPERGLPQNGRAGEGSVPIPPEAGSRGRR